MTHPNRKKNDNIVKKTKNKYQDPAKGSKFIPEKGKFFDKIFAFDLSEDKKREYDELSELKRDYVKVGRGKEFRAKTFVDKKTGMIKPDTRYYREKVGKDRVYKAPDVRYFPKDEPVEGLRSGGRAGYSVGGIAKRGVSKILRKK